MAQAYGSDMDLQVERYLRRNVIAWSGEAVFFWIGMMGFASASTVVPLFVRHLTASPFIIAAVAAIPSVGWFLPQLLTAPLVERLPRKLPFVVRLSLLVERPSYLVMAVAAFFLARRYPGAALMLFLLGYAMFGFGTGFLGTAWQDLTAHVIPVRLRGRLFGISEFTGALACIPAGLLAGVILERLPFPESFGLCFLLAFIAALISFGFMLGLREPEGPAPHGVVHPGPYVQRLGRILAGDRNFTTFLLCRSLMTLGDMAGAFVAIYAASRLALGDAAAGSLTALMSAGMLTANLGLGFLADHRGHKLTFGLAGVAYAAALALVLLAPSAAGFGLAFALQGAALAASGNHHAAARSPGNAAAAASAPVPGS